MLSSDDRYAPAAPEQVGHDGPSRRSRASGPVPEPYPEAKRWIDIHTETILGRMKTVGMRAHDAARRQAVEAWMLDQYIIEHAQRVNVLPQIQ